MKGCNTDFKAKHWDNLVLYRSH